MSTVRLPVFDRRRAGVLLPMSSIDAPLGRGGRAFIDWLASAGFSVWQVLPLGPTGSDGSPYWVRSDSAGNAALIDPQEPAPLYSSEFQAFQQVARDWLEDYAAFEVLSSLNHGTPWWTWAAEYRDRQPEAMERLRRDQAQARQASIQHGARRHADILAQLRAHQDDRRRGVGGGAAFGGTSHARPF